MSTRTMFWRVRNDQINSVCPVCKGCETRLVWRHLPELRFGIPDLFSIRRCVECGTCLTDPLPDQRYLEKIYEKNYVPAEYVPPDRLATVSEVEGLLAGKTVLLERWNAERSTEIPSLFYQPETSELFAGCRMILDVGAYTGENMLWLVAGGGKGKRVGTETKRKKGGD